MGPAKVFSRMVVAVSMPARPTTALVLAALPRRNPAQRCSVTLLLLVKRIAGWKSPSLADVTSVNFSIVTPAQPSTISAGPRPV